MRPAVRPGVGRARSGRADDGLRARAPRLRLPGRAACSSRSRPRSSAWRSRSSKFGSDELKERYLRRLIDGSIISAHAISEPEAGSDATAMATTATEDGDSYVINGKKAFCTSGPVADVITVYAKPDAEAGATGISAFLVDDRHARDQRRRADPEDGAEHVTDRRARVRRTAACRRSNLIGKPGGGLLHPRARDDLGDPLHLHHDGRGDAAPARGVHRLREEAHAVRRADRHEPVHPGQDRRPEDRRRDLPQAPLRHGRARSPGGGASRPRSRWPSS